MFRESAFSYWEVYQGKCSKRARFGLSSRYMAETEGLGVNARKRRDRQSFLRSSRARAWKAFVTSTSLISPSLSETMSKLVRDTHCHSRQCHRTGMLY
jgi:hypothetical protein